VGGRRTFTTIGELDMSRLLGGLEGLEELDAVGADAVGEEDAEAETEQGADGGVGGDLAGGGLEGFTVRRPEAVMKEREFIERQQKKQRRRFKGGGREVFEQGHGKREDALAL
jgi:hypothetical protein